MEAVLKYPGAKNRLAEWIISFIPEHRIYQEQEKVICTISK